MLDVFPSGGMLWHYRSPLHGKQERVTLGRSPALSPDEVRAFLKVAFDQAVAHACDSASACSNTVCVAFSCLSGG